MKKQVSLIRPKCCLCLYMYKYACVHKNSAKQFSDDFFLNLFCMEGFANVM